MTELIFKQVNMQTGEGCVFAILIALLCGFIIAVFYRFGSVNPSRYMIVATLIMPAVVQAVIMLVNGNIGTGIAVAGAFNLVRFRSVPGSSHDICILFLAMASGLACGIGFAGYALLFTLAISVVILIANKLLPADNGKNSRRLRVLIPEDMDYCGLFDDVFSEYTVSFRLNTVKSVRMGTMFELKYNITMKDPSKEKEMLDKLRCRNGNLTVACGNIPVDHDEL